MKLLIIGSKGFIGVHAMNYFKSQGFSVMGCDVVADTGSSDYVQIDATHSDFHTLFEKYTFDTCINCSGAASVPLSLEFPLNDFRLNTLNVFKILDAIKTFQPKCKLINLSSAAVYGNPTSLPISESALRKPLSPYGIHKLQAEQIVEEFYGFFNIACCSLRIFSAYGNGLKKQLFWDMYQKFNGSDTIELYGTGLESRDFIHVDDIIQALHLIIDHAKFEGEAINIANGEECTISYVSELFSKSFQHEKKLVFNNKIKPGDPLNWRADISLLKSMGYQKKVLIEDGIQRYIDWIKTL